MFLPILQSPSSSTWLVIRSSRDPQQLAVAMRNKLRDLDAGLPFFIQTWNRGLNTVLFPARMATLSLGVLGVMGAMLSITGIFGMAAYSVSKRLRELGIRVALGAQRKQVVEAALGRAFKLLALGSAAGLLLGSPDASPPTGLTHIDFIKAYHPLIAIDAVQQIGKQESDRNAFLSSDNQDVLRPRQKHPEILVAERRLLLRRFHCANCLDGQVKVLSSQPSNLHVSKTRLFCRHN